jgi:hypothetical protein
MFLECIMAVIEADFADHWLFSSKTRHVVRWRPVPFHIRPLGDKSLDRYAKSAARTVPLDRRQSDSDVRQGEILVTIRKRSIDKELSIHTNHLVPWVPVVSVEVIVITGAWLGAVGVAKEKKDKQWVVTFTVDDESRDVTFEEKDLAALERSTST